MHYFLNQRHFKNLYLYQGHSKKQQKKKNSGKKKIKKSEREENVNIKYKTFKYQKHYFNVNLIIKRKEKQSPCFLFQNFISNRLLFNNTR